MNQNILDKRKNNVDALFIKYDLKELVDLLINKTTNFCNITFTKSKPEFYVEIKSRSEISEYNDLNENQKNFNNMQIYFKYIDIRLIDISEDLEYNIELTYEDNKLIYAKIEII